MAFNKRWGSGATSTGVYSLATNWAAISLRNSAYRWVLSGSGTANYYLQTAAGGNPGVASPGAIYLDGSAAAAGTLGALTAGQYAYGDSDTLGYSTIYVRTSGSVDPDGLALDYVKMYQIPVTGDSVRIPFGSQAITSGLDQSAVTLVDWIADKHNAAIGSATEYLRVTLTGKFEYWGTATAYIDLGASAVAPQVWGTVGPQDGSMGLYLLGSALTTLSVDGGTVGLAFRGGETSTVSEARCRGASSKLVLGSGVTLTTDYALDGGTIIRRCNSTTCKGRDGNITTEEAAATTTFTAYGKTKSIHNASGTVGTYNSEDADCEADWTGSAEARACTNMNLKRGRVKYDPAVLSVGTLAVGLTGRTVNLTAA